MANQDATGLTILLDTFDAAISLSNLKIHSIEWLAPATFDDTCTVTEGVGGRNLVKWTCHDVNYPYIKYFPPLSYQSVDIAINGVGSGEVLITLR